ncbi:MAG: hypothetical protein MZW92_54800 [Comamonadaceae bacterium]|nr:hypothetical protein [Comamonadaceae bacterium]
MRRLCAEDLTDYKALRDTMLAAHTTRTPSPPTPPTEARQVAARGYAARLGQRRHPLDGQYTLGAWRGDRASLGARDLRTRSAHRRCATSATSPA